MTSKFLEICQGQAQGKGLGQGLLPMRFEIVEVRKNRFMLKSKDSHIGLLGALDGWLQFNNSMGEYSEMLWKRSGSLRQVLGEGVGSGFDVDRLNMTESPACINRIRDESFLDDDAIQMLGLASRVNLEPVIGKGAD